MTKIKKNFKITEVQSKQISENELIVAEEEIIKDIYYRIKEFELRIRDMDGQREFKLKSLINLEKVISIEDIKEKLGIELKSKIEDFIRKEGLQPIMECEIVRNEYRKGLLSIRIDHINFSNGQKDANCRLQSEVEDKDKVNDALNKMNEFAKQFNLEDREMSPQEEYLKNNKKENKELNVPPINKIH